MTRFKSFPLISMMALGMAMPALAQQPPATPAANGPQAAEPKDRNAADVIVVTANKREESVQDIAVAVTAISSALRDQIGLTTVQDYTNFAPGLSYSTASDRLSLRGVTRNSNNFGIRSGISNYVDGVYFSSAIPASREPIFIDRVEIVRGPQGTLYGRDSIGGALNVITKRPTQKFEAQVDLGVSTFNSHKIEATVAGPITDWLRYRVGGSLNVQNKGDLHNYSGLQSEGDRKNDSYFEAQLAGNIGEKFDWWVRAGTLSWDVRYGAPGARTGADGEAPYDTRLFGGGANTSGVGAFGTDIVPNGFFAFSGMATNIAMTGTQTTNPGLTDKRGFNTDFSNFAHLSPTQEYAAEAIYHAPGFDVKYLGGYVWYHYNLQQDNDGSPVQGFTFAGKNYSTNRVSDYNENRAWFSNEINLVSTGDSPLTWITGAYQYQENYTQPIYVSDYGPPLGAASRLNDILAFNFTAKVPVLPNLSGRNPASGSQLPGGNPYFFTSNQAVNHAYGLFAQGDYKFNDQWKVTAGVRWSKDILNGREYARLSTVNNTEEVLERAFGNSALIKALIPPLIDVTSTLGGADPLTVTSTNPCGLAGRGILNAKPTAANGGAGCGGSDRSRYGIYFDPTTGNAYRDLSGEWHEVTGVLGVDWTPDNDTLIYGKYNRGYKPGGIGAAATFGLMLNTPYTDKEILDAFEGGFKREWRSLNLTTNVAAFYYDYAGYQVSNQVVPDPIPGAPPGTPTPRPYTSYLNLPKVETTGIEIETTWRPTDDLRFLFNYGYINPKIKGGPILINSTDPYALNAGAKPVGPFDAANLLTCTISAGRAAAGETRCPRGQSIDGNILPSSPKNKIAVNGLYTWHLEDGAHIDTSLSYFWQDISYTSIFNRSFSKVPSWDQWDGRVSWISSDEHFTVIGFMRNILNEAQYESRGAGLRDGDKRDISPGVCGTTAANTVSHAVNPYGDLAQSCLAYGTTYRPPRTYGLELQFKY